MGKARNCKVYSRGKEKDVKDNFIINLLEDNAAGKPDKERFYLFPRSTIPIITRTFHTFYFNK